MIPLPVITETLAAISLPVAVEVIKTAAGLLAAINCDKPSAIAGAPYLSHSPETVMILSTENVFSCEAIASALSAKITATDSPIDFA